MRPRAGPVSDASDDAASSASSDDMTDRTMSSCCARWLPTQTTSSMLAVSDPMMAPTVLAA